MRLLPDTTAGLETRLRLRTLSQLSCIPELLDLSLEKQRGFNRLKPAHGPRCATLPMEANSDEMTPTTTTEHSTNISLVRQGEFPEKSGQTKNRVA
jgi:hypothetical protein